MWFDKSEFTRCLALQETAVSKDPESNQLSFAKLPRVTAAQGPERALPSQAQREVSAAGGPWANAQSHSQVGHQVNRLVAWRCGQAEPLCRGWPVGVPQHGVEGPGKVVSLRAAVVLLGGGQQAGQEQQQQQQQLEGQRRPDHPRKEGALGLGALGGSGTGHPGNRGRER